MKKNLFKILCGAIITVILCASLTACAGASWGGTTLKNPGETEGYQNIGFVYETENYLYYINGVANSSDDNTFGKPVKGALMAVDKSDISGKSEVVVPKLFASTNYKQGIFIVGEYVYYGTPSTDKTSSNTVAYNEMTFMRTKLDGTGSESFFTVGSLSTDYRFFELEGVVYVLYYDTDSTALKCYNTSTKTNVEIIKTDATIQTPKDEEKKEYGESLAVYKFTSTGVIFTTTVYNEEYSEDKINDSESARSTATYNKVYTFNAGDEKASLVKDGSIDGVKTEIKFVKDGLVFTAETSKNGVVNNYVRMEDFTEPQLANTEVIDEKNYINGGFVYVLNEGKVYEDGITKDYSEKQLVAICDTISTILFVDNDELYYLNSNTQLCKIKLQDEDAHEVILSENTAVSTWYTPAIITLGENETRYLMYADSSSYGLNYVKYIKLDIGENEIIEEDTDDDDKIDKWSYPESTSGFIGQIADEDKASIVTAKINAISNKLVNGNIELDVDEDGEYIVVDGKYSFEPVANARKAYEQLSAAAKSSVKESSLKTLQNYEKAIEKMALYLKLEGVEDYKRMPTDEKKASLEEIYNQVKADITAFMNSEDFSTVSAYINNQYKWYFQETQKIFEPKTENK